MEVFKIGFMKMSHNFWKIVNYFITRELDQRYLVKTYISLKWPYNIQWIFILLYLLDEYFNKTMHYRLTIEQNKDSKIYMLCNLESSCTKYFIIFLKKTLKKILIFNLIFELHDIWYIVEVGVRCKLYICF